MTAGAPQPALPHPAPHPAFLHERFLLQGDPLLQRGSAFDLLDPDGGKLLRVERTPMRMRTEVLARDGGAVGPVVLGMARRRALAWRPAFDMTGPGGEAIGTAERRGLASMRWDKWILRGPDGREAGVLAEDPGLRSAGGRIRDHVRFDTGQEFHLVADGERVGSLARERGLLAPRYAAELPLDLMARIDRRLALGAMVLAAVLSRF